MEWKFTIHKNYIEISTNGIADKDSSIAMAKAITGEMRKNKIKKVLIDHGNLDTVTGSVLDIYERPKIFNIIGAILGIRIAEVIKPEHLEHFKFLETVCVNQGFQLQIFIERDQAIQWLLS
ncbi:MAG: hypothetical protein EHM64_16510 [Ignavibacteriae bacterium]|nr:MAG: hypothetical protein EHM64_16510 [Ignavibacteriota bacterium]